MGLSERTGGRVFGLDVVRAAAVSLVLLSHCGSIFAAWYGRSLPWWLGVSAYFGIELFFVLSGFLIGRLLIEIIDRDPGPRAWLLFMVRRWMRTLPIYYVWLVVLAIFLAPLIYPPHSGQLARDLLRYGTMTQNLAWPMIDGYFDVSWTLAVEEWFYLLFSAVLIALAMVLQRRVAFWLSIGVFVGLPALLRWCFLAAGASDHIVLFWLDCIAFGVIAAWVSARHPRAFRMGALLLPLYLAATGFLWHGGLGDLGLSPRIRRTVDFEWVAVTQALCLPAAVRWREASGLAASLIRRLSEQSYGIYLMHLSVMEILNYWKGVWHLRASFCVALTLVLVFGLSFLSWRYFERPILRLRPHALPRRRPVAVEPLAG